MSWKPCFALASPLAVAAALRIGLWGAVLFRTGSHGLLAGDTASYLEPGRNLLLQAAFQTAGLPEIGRTPGYPLFLALASLPGWAVASLLQVVLSVCSVWLAARLARAVGRDRAWRAPCSVVHGSGASRAGLLGAPASCFYISQPQSDKDKVFKPEIAVLYRPAELPPKLEKWLLGDPSISEEKDADYFPVICVAINRQNNDAWITDRIRLKLKQPAQAVAEISLMLDRNFGDQDTLRVALETVSFQRIYKFEMARELGKKKKPYRVEELKPGGRAKRERIMGLQPQYESGKIHFRAGVEIEPGHFSVSPDFDLLMQMEQFPFGSKVDDLDCLAYYMDLIREIRGEGDEKPPENRLTKTLQQVRISGKQSSVRRKFA